MMDNSKEIKERVEVCFNFLTIKRFIKDNSKMTNLMEKGYFIAVLINTQEIFLMGGLWDKVNCKLRVCITMRANLKMENSMAMEYYIK